MISEAGQQLFQKRYELCTGVTGSGAADYRHGTLSLYAALHTASGKVIGDPEFEEKAMDIIGLYQKPPLNAAVFSYDAQDNLVRYRGENGAVTKLEYCGLWEIRRRRQPDGHTVQFYYDTAERLIGVTNQRGERYELRRDPLGTCCRIVGGLREDGCSVKSFIY